MKETVTTPDEPETPALGLAQEGGDQQENEENKAVATEGQTMNTVKAKVPN